MGNNNLYQFLTITPTYIRLFRSLEVDTISEQFETPTAASTPLQAPRSEPHTHINVSGRRIVDFGYVFQCLKVINNHEPFHCGISEMSITSELRKGFCSVFTLVCSMCGMSYKLATEDPMKEAQQLNINTAAVSGVITTGGGYSQLDELTSVCDIPCLAKDTYKRYHEKVSAAAQDCALSAMQAAAREECILAQTAGDVDSQGYPLIAVVVDGAWSKRSYKTNYNSASGVVCICSFVS